MKNFDRNIRLTVKDSFKKHILKMVLARIDFEPLFNFDGLVGLYQSHFKKSFSVASEEQVPGYDIEVSDIQNPKITIRDIEKTFSLSTADHIKKIKFSKGSLILEHHKYSHFDEFSSEFLGILDFIFGQPNVAFIPRRFGLRKVNTIVLPENESVETFVEYFNECLIQHLKIPFLSRSLNADRHLLNFYVAEDELGVNLQFSTEQGSTDQGKARRFILDIDIYSERLPETLTGLKPHFEKMNNLLFDLFWWSIGTKTLEYLQEK